MTETKKIAVIGCGVAGLTAAHLLQRKYDITLFEKNDYLGGHTHTIELPDGPDAGTPVDTGFIVCNDQTYPYFHKLLDDLEVKLRPSTMSFSYFDEESGFHYAGNSLNGLFAQRRNLINPAFWNMLLDIRRFCKNAMADIEADAIPEITIKEYLEIGKYGKLFAQCYLYPMMAAIWSSPPSETAFFPASALVSFFRNHGLLSLKNRPNWQTVQGGSHAYVKAFKEKFTGKIRLSCPVKSVKRTEKGIILATADEEMSFDKVVIAAHADQALSMLSDASPEERRLLKPWEYQKNKVVLHADSNVLPPSRCAWSSWNYTREMGKLANRPVSVSYYMNCLQGLKASQDYCVSLNRNNPVDRDKVVCELEYMHPMYSFDSMNTQSELDSLNGVRNTYFCGSYFGYGFHEDAVRSSVSVCKALGEEL